MGISRRRIHLWAFAALVLLAIAALTHEAWLSALGGFLVNSDAPYKADIIVVLAGDYRGNRILHAAGLVRDGLAPKILVSGPEGMYGHYECDMAIAFATKKGHPAEWFEPYPNACTSTRCEADLMVPELRRRGVRRFMVVTSDYHTRRTGSLFRKAGPDADFRVVAAPDWAFRVRGWWRSREGQKQFTLEWIKTFACWAGL